ncbi:MAG: S8 family serine peptidase, partial [Clostridia bacterium]|nr:S8 family serine peptidase [Clostridia bacterium]
MTNRFRKILCSALFAVFALSIFAGHATSLAAGGGENVAKVFLASFEDVTGTVDGSRVSKANFSDSVLSGNFRKSETRTVIVSLEGENVISAANKGQTASEYLATASGRKTASAITAKQNTFYKRLNAKGVKYEKITAYSVLDNAVAIKIDTADIAAVKSIPGVRTAVVSRSYLYPQTVAVVNETNVYATGIYDSSDIIDEYSGEGMLVAVLDTGLDYTHAAFRKLPDDLSKIAYTKADVADILANKNLTAEETTPGLEVNDVFVSEKVPFAYDYADKDPDVYPSYSNHGTHVAGIIAGNDDHYNDKDGNLVEEPFVSVAPNAQLVICKVFTDDLEDDGIGGASTEDILAALEDCVLLNVDVINMSLGSTSGFTNTDDGDDDGEYMHRIYSSIKDSGISLICAGSNDYSSGYGGTFGTNLSSNPDSGTVGSPSTYAAALSVASISGQPSKYMLGNEGLEGYETAVFYEESNDANSNPFDFAKGLMGDAETGEFEYVVIGGVGRISDYNNAARRLLPGRIALVKRGDTTFQEKVEIAKSMGAMGAIIYNNVSGKIRMSLGEIEDPIPAVSISMDAGKALVEGARHDSTANDIVGKIRIDKSLTAGPFMSDFSSWGTTPDLRIKPEITAHGGEITSAVPGGYDEYSGTSMASPNMAGVAALVRGYVKDRFGITDRVEITRIVNQLIMSTATIVYDETDLPYSPRKQGAGLASLYSSIKKTDALLYVDDAYIDNRPKLEFGDDPSRTGVYGGTFYVRNFGTSGLTYDLSAIFMTETLASDNIAVAEKAYLLTDVAPQFTVDGAAASSVYVPAGESKAISVTLTLSDAEKNYIDSSFKNGMYVEGFVTLTPASDEYCNLNIPFLGFYGDWTDAPLLDYSAYEIAAFEQDTSILEDEKPKASVWATQPYAKYEEKYIIPLGSYVYNLDDNDEPMYTSEEHAAVSRYDADFHSTHEIYAIYAGLLRNARTANYTVTNVDTGELIYEDTIYRIGKASANRPAYVGLEFDPEINGMYENGHYKMDFDFALDYNGGNITGENNFSFSFYVDYDAPVLKEARVRYYDYKDGNRDKQRIYLDLDVYDNHYAQAILMCYVENNELQLATDYVTPVRNAVKNGVTTVSIEITNLYDFFRKDSNGMYIEIEDYAMNWRTYRIDLANANTTVLPATFDVAENRISVGVN